MPKFYLSLTAKLLALNAVIVIAVGGIVAANVLISHNIGEKLFSLINRDLITLRSNAELAKDLGNMFAETQLFINSFLERQDLLEQEKARLIQFLDERLTNQGENGEDAVFTSLQDFRHTLQTLFEQSAKFVELSSSLQKDRELLERELTQTADLTQELLVSFSMEGKGQMLFAVEQVSISIATYRNLLLQIQVRLSASKYAYFNTKTVDNVYEKEVERLLGELDTELLLIAAAGEELRPSGDRLLEQLSEYQNHIQQFYHTMQAFQEQLHTISNVQAQIMDAMEGINLDRWSTMKSTQQEMLENIKSSENINLSFSAIILCMLLLTAVSALKVLRPITSLAAVADQLSLGNISYNIDNLPRKNSKDEIGTLSRAFQKLILHNRKVADTATKIAHGDLAVDFTPRSEEDVLGHALVEMSSYLNEIATVATAFGEGDLRGEIAAKTDHDILGHAFQKLKGLQHSIGNIVQSTAQLKSASGDLYQISEKMVGSTQQSSQKAQTVSQHSRQIDENVNAVATATEEMSASIREISRNSSSIAHIAETAVERANSANTLIKGLERQSHEISEIIAVITSVTQQTNLLALNATIEAARAGDFGKGFAVVANEIKQLSRETAESAEDIIRKLEGIQAGTSDATEAITEVLSINTQISEISSATASGVVQQSSSTNEIADRMGEIANGSQGITQLINEVALSTQKTSEGAIGVQYAAQELASLADDLQQLVDKFKV